MTDKFNSIYQIAFSETEHACAIETARRRLEILRMQHGAERDAKCAALAAMQETDAVYCEREAAMWERVLASKAAPKRAHAHGEAV